MTTGTWQLIRGAAAERAVADYLVARGFSIVARNLRLGRDELDLVARRESLIVVVEVRTRAASAWTTSFGSILPEKRRRVRRAARRLWCQRYARDQSVDRLRIDAAAVVFDACTDGKLDGASRSRISSSIDNGLDNRVGESSPRVIYSAAAF